MKPMKSDDDEFDKFSLVIAAFLVIMLLSMGLECRVRIESRPSGENPSENVSDTNQGDGAVLRQRNAAHGADRIPPHSSEGAHDEAAQEGSSGPNLQEQETEQEKKETEHISGQ